MGFGGYHAGAYLLVCEELYSGVWEDAEEGCRVSFEESGDAIVGVDVAECDGDAAPFAGVLCEVWV